VRLVTGWFHLERRLGSLEKKKRHQRRETAQCKSEVVHYGREQGGGRNGVLVLLVEKAC